MNIGLATSHLPPFQLGLVPGTIEALENRTPTPFGFPVVPDV